VAEATRLGDEPVWRAAVVATGLLGVSPLDLDLPYSGDPWNVRALVLGTMLAGPQSAAEALLKAGLETMPGAGDIADLALRRLECARLMTVVG
jgi:hypothetical protein